MNSDVIHVCVCVYVTSYSAVTSYLIMRLMKRKVMWLNFFLWTKRCLMKRISALMHPVGGEG